EAVADVGHEAGDFNAAVFIARKADPTLGALFSHIDADHLSAAALLLALDDLRINLERQRPFAGALALARQLTGGADPSVQDALSRLAPYAAGGVPNIDALRTELKAVSAGVTEAEVLKKSTPFWNKTLRRLTPFARIRRAGTAQGQGPDAV